MADELTKMTPEKFEESLTSLLLQGTPLPKLDELEEPAAIEPP